ncbi:MAG: YdeI/OmpD-associated family protein [Bacteroidetes bacterium]|nr:YdeI/OmpD-associated family protein [Bacteroidota bacterium]
MEYDIISFENSDDFRHWLEINHAESNGIWLRIYKKASAVVSINYNEALLAALCFGWIDGQIKTFDEFSYIQKFTPRRPKSLWSKRNIGIAEQLILDGKMHAAGLKAINEAKADGRWHGAYDSPSNMTIPEDLIIELTKDKKAADFFESLNKINKYAIVWRLQTARNAEIRAKRMKTILEMLAKAEKYHN